MFSTVKQFISGAQILFVAFGALVLVPLLTGLNPAMALLGAGVGTLMFQLLTGRQVPIFLGSSFAFIGPIIFAMQTWGQAATQFGLFFAGFMYFVVAAIIKWRGMSLINRLLPPVVIGPVIMVIGLSVAVAASGMAMGQGGGKQLVEYGPSMLLAAISLATTIIVAVFAGGLLRLVPILSGVIVGYVVAAFMGIVNFGGIAAAPWFAMPHFVSPEVNWAAALFMLPVAIAPAIEHIGAVMAVGKVTGNDYTTKPGLHRTLTGDGLGVCFAGLIGGPPITTYSEVTGALMITRNFNPVIMTYAAVLAVILAFFGKFNAILQSIPLPVMGGIMVLLFGTIASIGLKTLIDAKVDLMAPRNLVIVAVILTCGIGGLTLKLGGLNLAGVGLVSILAIVLNLILPQDKQRDGIVEGQDI
ncbi:MULTISPECIES: uracil-xanthine permease family protein [Silvimonas]|uniref:uracil-xanthine permease family protein n=1 Tax=Silvimonas TaxID=300264 RepID=UPI0024B3BB40|nr:MULTISPECIES: uracil-xanthine permease family protein [Silvimonas]MDR3428431.1 uracil-xanthine permease family protein [Silvimonas sp.]